MMSSRDAFLLDLFPSSLYRLVSNIILILLDDRKFQLILLIPYLRVLDGLAQEFCLPVHGMASVVLSLASAFSPSTWVTGAYGQIEPLQLWIVNLGPSGVNKSGLFTLVEHVYKEVIAVMRAARQDVARCVECGIYVDLKSMPVRDRTATAAAAIALNATDRALFRNDDEWVAYKRALSNGSSGGGDLGTGVQHPLRIYNGPLETANILKNSSEVSLVPRLTTLVGMQPNLLKELGPGSSLFEVGFTARQLFVGCSANSSTPGNSYRVRQLTEFIVAIAARSLAVSGKYGEVDDDEKEKIEENFRGSDSTPFTEVETIELMYLKNKFTGRAFGSSGEINISKMREVALLNQRNLVARARAQSMGVQVAGRFATNYDYTINDGEHTKSLPPEMFGAGIRDIRVFAIEKGSPADGVISEASSIKPAESDSMRTIIEGKKTGQLLRLAAAFQVLIQACTDVDTVLGPNEPCDGTKPLVDFMFEVAASCEDEKLKKDVSISTPIHWGRGTEISSLLPASCFEPISQEAATSSALFYHSSLECLYSSLAKDGVLGMRSPVKQKNSQQAVTEKATSQPTLPAITRVDVIVRELILSKFNSAPVQKVSSLRLRAGSKDSGVSSELDLLQHIQHSGLFQFSVHFANTGAKNIIVHKVDQMKLSVEEKMAMASKLSSLDSTFTLDSFRGKQGKFDIDIKSLGTLVPTKDLPIGLTPFDPLESMASDLLQPPRSITPPLATQERTTDLLSPSSPLPTIMQDVAHGYSPGGDLLREKRTRKED